MRKEKFPLPRWEREMNEVRHPLAKDYLEERLPCGCTMKDHRRLTASAHELLAALNNLTFRVYAPGQLPRTVQEWHRCPEIKAALAALAQARGGKRDNTW